MRIQHNIPAMSAYRNYTNNTSALSKNLEKLSSGYKINRAGDDAAGLAISEKMRAQITGLEVAQKNAKDGISLVQTAEGALTEVHDMLNRMYELAEQSANGTYQDEVDREQLQKEIESLTTEINRIADSANFNGIKLLDGSLGSSSESMTTSGINSAAEVDFSDGITPNNIEASGSKGVYKIDLNESFGNSDKINITFDWGSGYDGAVAITAVPGFSTTDGSITLEWTADMESKTQGTNGVYYFTGKDKAEQAASIKDALESCDGVKKNFTVEVDADSGSVTLTNINEGNKELTINSVKIGTTTVAAAFTTTQAGSAGFKGGHSTVAAIAGSAQGTITFGNLFSSGTGLELDNGGTLIFELKDKNGKVWKAEVDIETAAGDSDYDTAKKVATALADVNFVDDENTLMDESKIKFGDMFTVSAPSATSGDLVLKGANGKGADIFGGITAGALTVKLRDNEGMETTWSKTTGVTVTGFTAGTGAMFDVMLDLDTADADTDYSNGDVLKFEGTLSGGTKFDFELVAGKDFEIGKDHKTTNENIAKALQEKNKIKINVDGVTDKEVYGSDIFGTNKDFAVTSSQTGVEISSNMKTGNTVLSGGITNVTIETAETGSVGSDLRNGIQQTGASSTLTFEDNKVKYGAVIQIGEGDDKKSFEIVADQADVTTEGAIALVVTEDQLKSGKELAKQVATALQAELGTDKMDIKASGNKVTFTDKTAVGSASKSPKVDAIDGKQKAVQFTFNPDNITAGSTVKINGKTYEFVKKAEDVSTNNKGEVENIAIVVEDLGKKGALTAKQLGDALEKEVKANDTEVDVSVADDGLVTVKSTVRLDSGSFKDISVELNRKGGLRLQIGDTAETFNQLTVQVNDCHAKAMRYEAAADATGFMAEADGMTLADIDISTQDGAAKAMAVIKGAVNYVSDVRGTLGATQNRLDHTINNLSVMQENIQDAESTIRDVDVAKEMMEYTKNNILVQSAQAMLAQANQLPQGVLQLLQ